MGLGNVTKNNNQRPKVYKVEPPKKRATHQTSLQKHVHGSTKKKRSTELLKRKKNGIDVFSSIFLKLRRKVLGESNIHAGPFRMKGFRAKEQN